LRFGEIASEELKSKQEYKIKNALFLDKIESDPGLMIVVTPDKSVESIDGSISIDTMTNINFKKKMKRFRHNASPYHDFGNNISSRQNYLDMNKMLLPKRKFEKSASLRILNIPKFNVDSLLEDLNTKSLTNINSQVMDNYKVQLAHAVSTRDRELFRTRS
jgi:hypothetical protein